VSVVPLSALVVRQTKAQIYALGLAVANAIGLPVSSWQPGDPTRSLFHLESEMLSILEDVVVGYVQSRFLDLAEGDWLKVKADQDFNVTVPPASFATTDVTLTNTGGGYFPDMEPGDITFRNTISGKTYTSTTGGTLASGTELAPTTLTVTVVADEAGSDSSAGAGEIDFIVTGMNGVECTNLVAALAVDEQDEATTRQQCRDKLGSFSPNGPKEAYAYVARNAELTGTSAISRVRVYGDSDVGEVTVYIAGPGGAVSEPDRVLVETAILRYATPICITPTVLSASNVVVPVTYSLWIYKRCGKTDAEIRADVLAALEAMFATRAIGGDIIEPATGKLYRSLIESTIRAVFPVDAFRVTVALPAGDTALTRGQVAALGTVTPSIFITVDP
jgi:hypothetical protein